MIASFPRLKNLNCDYGKSRNDCRAFTWFKRSLERRADGDCTLTCTAIGCYKLEEEGVQGVNVTLKHADLHMAWPAIVRPAEGTPSYHEFEDGMPKQAACRGIDGSLKAAALEALIVKHDGTHGASTA